MEQQSKLNWRETESLAVFLKGVGDGLSYGYNTLKSLAALEELARKRKEALPQHPYVAACYLWSLNFTSHMLREIARDAYRHERYDIFEQNDVDEIKSKKLYDLLLSATLLHDSVKDIESVVFIEEYGISPVVIELAKKVNWRSDLENFAEHAERLAKDPFALLISLSACVTELSVMDVSNAEAVKERVLAEQSRMLPLFRIAKQRYPAIKPRITVMKYQFTSICAFVAGLMFPEEKTPEVATWNEDYAKTAFYLEGRTSSSGSHVLARAASYVIYAQGDQVRNSGASYLVHLMRVYVFLSALCDDIDEDTLAASLLHDVKEDVPEIKNNPELLMSKYGFSKDVFHLVNLLTKIKGGDTTEYYKKLRTDYRAILVKLSDRVNNVSTMDVFDEKRIRKYIKETNEHVIPLCQYAYNQFPELRRMLNVMWMHMATIVELAEEILKHGHLHNGNGT